MDENEQLVSKYSSGVNINLRLDQLWKDSHLHSRNGNYNTWNLDLDCIWSELARDLGDKENKKKDVRSYEEIEKEFAKFEEEILKNGVIKDTQQKGFAKATEKELKSRAEHYKVLRKKQLFLARLENKVGKGTTWNNNEEDDID